MRCHMQLEHNIETISTVHSVSYISVTQFINDNVFPILILFGLEASLCRLSRAILSVKNTELWV